MRTVLNTVGTSLLTKYQKERGEASPSLDALVRYLRETEPQKASAETNLLHRLLQEGDRLLFLHSQTEEGRLCAEALVRHYRGEGYRAETREVAGLNYTHTRFKMRGLRSLVSALAGSIRQARQRGEEVLINATGGFKAEIAYATLVGLLFGVPVYYIHEKFDEPVDMPPVPVGWDLALYLEAEGFLRWLNEGPHPLEEVDRSLWGLPEAVRVLVEEDEVDGQMYGDLSPAGKAFLEAYDYALALQPPAPLYLSPPALGAIQGLDPHARARLEGLLGKLRNPLVRRSGAEAKQGTDCLVFPRGRRAERVLFYEEGGQVFVCEVFTDHQDYERALARGVWRRNYSREGFRPWP